MSGEEPLDVGPDRVPAGVLGDANDRTGAAQRGYCGGRVGIGERARHVGHLGDLESGRGEERLERFALGQRERTGRPRGRRRQSARRGSSGAGSARTSPPGTRPEPATRPPGAVTRFASRSASAGSAAYWNELKPVTASNEPSVNGSHCRSPCTMVRAGHPSPGVLQESGRCVEARHVGAAVGGEPQGAARRRSPRRAPGCPRERRARRARPCRPAPRTAPAARPSRPR